MQVGLVETLPFPISLPNPDRSDQSRRWTTLRLIKICPPPLPPPFFSSSYPVESGGGGLPAKVKKSRSSNGSIKKVESRKSLSLEAAQLELQQQQKTLTRQVAVR